MADAAQPAARAGLVLESREGGVATLTLNRPERLNALNVELGTALLEALRRVAQEKETRAVILTGAGRAFCSGGDVGMLRDARTRHAGSELEALLRAATGIVLALAGLEKPVVAAVNGPAAGGGMNLALACDFLIASDQASFGQNFAKIGLFPDFGGMVLLPRLVGAAHAAEMFYTGDMIGAAEAERIGVVNRVVPHERFAEEVRALGARLAAAPPLAARAVKKMLFGGDRAAFERALEAEARQQIECFLSEDCLEGLNAFFEKRAPRFRGR
jgi:2-(1,2-epoxy-1,2-dihydrophenyl)acetyl-CoA isomerase